MKKTIFIFHGTGGHPQENWYPWLKKKLEEKGHAVFVPHFPTPKGQSLEAWLKVLEDYKKDIDENSIMIGHSLGGLFLLRVLEKLPLPIKAAFFVAAPIGIKPILYFEGDRDFSGNFSLDWENIKRKAQHFEVFHSDNDPYICLENGQQLAKNLGAKLTLVPHAGHFNTEAGYLEFKLLLEKLVNTAILGTTNR
ncbi:MAG: alpha/beta hydrolase [Patescibacteria group bacterium]